MVKHGSDLYKKARCHPMFEKHVTPKVEILLNAMPWWTCTNLCCCWCLCEWPCYLCPCTGPCACLFDLLVVYPFNFVFTWFSFLNAPWVIIASFVTGFSAVVTFLVFTCNGALVIGPLALVLLLFIF